MTSKIYPIEDLAEVRTGDGAPQEVSAFSDRGIPFVRAGSLRNLLNGQNEDELEKISPDEISRRRMQRFPAGTIVFAKSGMSCTKGLVYELKGECCVVNHLAAVQCGPDLDSRFLVRWLEKNPPSRLIANSSYPSIKVSDIRADKLELPHKNGKPDLDEQRRIAAILDKADAIRRKRQQALRLTDDFLLSLFLDMFGDPVTNPKGLQSLGLFDVCKMTSGATPSKARKDFWNGRIPWISPKDMKAAWLPDSIDHISDAALEETNIKLFKPNTVLIVIRGMILAHSFPVAQPLVSCTINQDMKGLVPNEGFNEHYIAWSLRCQLGNIMSKVSTAGHGTRRFDNNALRSLPVLNADPKRQETFASIVENCRSLDRKTATLLRCSSNHFASLQQLAFRGEL